MNTEINFSLAKLLKEKEFEGNYSHFYTSPNSKMFGLDEHNRYYPIINTPKKLYTVGIHAALNIKNVFAAPTLSEVVMWIYEKYNIWIELNRNKDNKFCIRISLPNKDTYTKGVILEDGSELRMVDYFDSLILAYNAAIEYVLKNLIK